MPKVGKKHFAYTKKGKKALELKERKVRGFPMPEFLGLLVACVLPISEAATDWSVVYKWYLDGDTGWFGIGLAISWWGAPKNK